MYHVYRPLPDSRVLSIVGILFPKTRVCREKKAIPVGEYQKNLWIPVWWYSRYNTVVRTFLLRVPALLQLPKVHRESTVIESLKSYSTVTVLPFAALFSAHFFRRRIKYQALQSSKLVINLQGKKSIGRPCRSLVHFYSGTNKWYSTCTQTSTTINHVRKY